jgi:hypothetical protein
LIAIAYPFILLPYIRRDIKQFVSDLVTCIFNSFSNSTMGFLEELRPSSPLFERAIVCVSVNFLGGLIFGYNTGMLSDLRVTNRTAMLTTDLL